MTGFSPEEKPEFLRKTRRFRAPEPKNHPLTHAMSLFKEADFSSPHQSPLFAELLTLNDPEARSVAAQLMAAAQKRLDETPLLEEVFPEGLVSHIVQPPAHTTPISGGVAQESPQVASRAVTAPSGPPAGPIPRWLPDVVRAERAGSPLIPGPLRRASRMDGKTGNVPVGAWVVGAVVLVFLLAGAAGAFYLLKGNNLTKQGMEPSVAQNRPSEIDSHETVKQNPDIVQKDTETPKEGPLDPRPNKEVVNSIGMKLVVIPAGKFIMGSPPTEEGRDANEGPQHEVAISRSFYMGASPVTRGQFAVFVKAESYMTEAETGGQGGGGYNQATRKGVDHDPKYTWNNPGFDQTDYHPVVNVTWNDAVRFCRWLRNRAKITYRNWPCDCWPFGAMIR
jgi:hypothetical protein